MTDRQTDGHRGGGGSRRTRSVQGRKVTRGGAMEGIGGRKESSKVSRAASWHRVVKVR